MPITLLVKKRPKKMKKWQDCQWLRVRCGKDDCLICRKINKDKAAHIAKGKDPDSWECVFEDMGRNFKEMLELLHVEADKRGISLEEEKEISIPEDSVMPTDYPLYNQIMDWRQGICDIAEDSGPGSDAWLYTEAGKDLMWYSSTLLAKIFRQISNVEEMKSGKEEYMDMEYAYTGYVLGQVLEIIKKSLIELSKNGGAHADKFNIARLSLVSIEEAINNY